MYNIETLAKLTGLTRRTIRYYIQKGLLDPPEGGGRGSYYTDSHVEQVKKIKTLSEQGVLLIKMKEVMEGNTPSEEKDDFKDLAITRWERCHLAPEVDLVYGPGIFSLEDLSEIRQFMIELMNRRKQ
ncbi:MAG: MerR family transcriptional regulator [Spirochaetales bacterium]|nr:MerR family transcriptional regulator [Spirochaetales bacterium]